MANVLLNGLPVEVFFNGTTRTNPVKLIVEDILMLSEKEATNLADIIIQLYKVGVESKTMNLLFSDPILKKRITDEDKVQDKEAYLQKDHSQK